jgi:hypothetical protein
VLFLITATGYLFFEQILTGHQAIVGRLCILGLCLCGLVMAATAVWSFKAVGTVWPHELGNVWAFVRGGTPEREDLRTVYVALRTYIAVSGVMIMFILTWLLFSTVGLA